MTILIEVTGKRWKPAKFIKTKKLRHIFEDWLAEEFVRLIKLSVEKQRYSSQWAPLSQKWLQRKRQMGWSTKTWEASKELIKELHYTPRNRSIGWDNRRVHTISGTKYLKIAISLEFGTKNIPARPLFRVVQSYMSKNISFFYNKFLKEVT